MLSTPHLNLRLPWAQLTDLTVAHDSPQTCLEILMQSTNIVAAYFATHGWEQPPTGNNPICTLRGLRTLILEWSGGGHFVPFLERLDSIRETKSALLALRPVAQIYLVQHGLQANCLTDTLLRAMCYSAYNPRCLVPRLHHVMLSRCLGAARGDVVIDMITSRWWSESHSACRRTLDACGGLTTEPGASSWLEAILLDLDDIAKLMIARFSATRVTLVNSIGAIHGPEIFAIYAATGGHQCRHRQILLSFA
ncbi:hypothetical protein FB451DRAFT_1179300 [Mycena latifolia]|nr:hypothetical protein FB451DRAFT_1179300 [Mycena latifolia]